MTKLIKRRRKGAANGKLASSKASKKAKVTKARKETAKEKSASQASQLEHFSPPSGDLHNAEYVRTTRVDVFGATAPDGVPWISLSAVDGDKHSWVRLDELSDDAAPARKRMRGDGLILFKGDQIKALDAARSVTDFPPMPLIDKPGWSANHFALRSGEVFSPDDQLKAIVLFQPDSVTCSAKGSKAWLAGAQRIAKGQPLVAFALMIPFAGPLLQLSRVTENIGFEWSGIKGVGKTTIQQLATSVCGPALEPAGQNYWIGANTTMNALEAELPRHADMLMVIEELSVMHAGDSDRVRANRMREFIFRMAQGTIKGRYQEAKQVSSRFVWMTSTNDPLATLLGKVGGDASEAAGDRLLALPIGRNRKHGIFKAPLPKGCNTGEDAARAINELIADNYGWPIRDFLRHLVIERAADETVLRADIETSIAQFRDAVGVDGNVGSEARVADAFGLVYAAGKLAQRYGSIPAKLDCLAAATKCYRMNRKSVGAEVGNVERLLRLAKRKGVVSVDLEDRSKSYRERLFAAPALVLTSPGGKRELLLSSKQFEKAFPKRRALLADPAVKRLMRHDKNRSTIKVKVAHNGPSMRFRCFNVSSNDE